jgi:hypothetical protein
MVADKSDENTESNGGSGAAVRRIHLRGGICPSTGRESSNLPKRSCTSEIATPLRARQAGVLPHLRSTGLAASTGTPFYPQAWASLDAYLPRAAYKKLHGNRQPHIARPPSQRRSKGAARIPSISSSAMENYNKGGDEGNGMGTRQGLSPPQALVGSWIRAPLARSRSEGRLLRRGELLCLCQSIV